MVPTPLLAGRTAPLMGLNARSPAPDDLAVVADLCQRSLQLVAGADWDRLAGSLEWTCRQTLQHLCGVLYLYAGQLATRATTAPPAPTPIATAAATIDQLLDTMRIAALILVEVTRAASPEARAFHPAGMADATGWVAMAIDELVIHTNDIACGLGIELVAPGENVVRSVLDRLFPWWPGGTEPMQALLWANGRASLPDYPSPGASWLWHCAPLEEWDGSVPRWDPLAQRPA